ncbi:MAG: hypothetical protein H6684_11540 [Deltaproteobacteria bacterium]|nr:hypothetical protein [Deltaproteobacteria bacterium]MCB9478372.1 hypothetical protein [Deltaproteobacteria bacterium]MCB9489356.1 hypothetical protein [Deltaproteobacteria bacterium]
MHRIGTITIFLIAAMVFALGACDTVVEEKKDGSKPEEVADPDPPTYIKTMEAVAVGDRVYRFERGLWTEQEIDESYLPLRSVAFVNPNLGFAGGQGVVLKYRDGLWQPETVAIPPHLMVKRMIASPMTGDVWAIAVSEDGTDSRILHRGPSGAWEAPSTMLEVFGAPDVEPLDVIFLQDDSGIGLLGRQDKDAIFHWRKMNGEGENLIYAYDPDSWRTFECLGRTPEGNLAAGGYLNRNLNNQGFVRFLDINKLLSEDNSGDPKDFLLYDFSVPMAECPEETVNQIIALPEDGVSYVVGRCSRDEIYMYQAGVFEKIDLPGTRGPDYDIAGADFIDRYTGWAVGYQDEKDRTLFLLRDANGWQSVIPVDADNAPLIADGNGEHLYAVDVWEGPEQTVDGRTRDEVEAGVE